MHIFDRQNLPTSGRQPPFCRCRITAGHLVLPLGDEGRAAGRHSQCMFIMSCCLLVIGRAGSRMAWIAGAVARGDVIVRLVQGGPRDVVAIGYRAWLVVTTHAAVRSVCADCGSARVCCRALRAREVVVGVSGLAPVVLLVYDRLLAGRISLTDFTLQGIIVALHRF